MRIPQLPKTLESPRYSVCVHYEPEELANEVSDMIELGWVPVGGRFTGEGMRPATDEIGCFYKSTVYYQTMYKPEPLIVVDTERA